MDFGKAFTFMFQDPDWLRKVAIGTAVTLVGVLLSPFLIGIIPLIMVTGYTIDVIRNLLAGRERVLPEWEDWGGFLGRGFKVVVATLVWALPAIILSIPLVIGSALTDSNNGGGTEAVGIIVLVCSSCLLILWALFLTLITPAIYVRIAATDRIGSAFEFGKVWAFTRDNLGSIIVAILLTWVAGLIAAVIAGLGLVALIIGVLVSVPFASFWQMLVNAHLYGQIGAQSVAAID